MGNQRWRHRNHTQNDDFSQQSDRQDRGYYNQMRLNGRPPNVYPQLGSYTVSDRASASGLSNNNSFQRRNEPQGLRNITLNPSNDFVHNDPPQGPRKGKVHFVSDNQLPKNNRIQRPVDVSSNGHDINRTPRSFGETAFMLKSKRFKQHLLHSMERNLQEIQLWYPDEEEDGNDDEMDWQPETEILIPPLAYEIRCVFDSE